MADAELLRDADLVGSAAPIAVETWHPGNLAYVLVRNEALYPEMVHHIKSNSSALSNGKVLGITLDVSPDSIKKRTKTFADNPEWAADFYSRVNGFLPQTLQALGLESSTVSIDANKSFEETYQQVKSIIKMESLCI